MKKFLLSILMLVVLVLAVGLKAANYRSILINKVDGTQLTVTMEAGLTTTFAEGNMLLTSTNNNVTLPLAETKSWTFSTEGSVVGPVDPEPEVPAEYHYNTGSALHESQRGVNTLEVIVDNDKSKTTQISGNGINRYRAIYTDRTSSVVTANPGSTINVQCVSGAGSWMHSMVYVDYNKDGQFNVSLASNGIPNSDSELVAFNCAATQKVGEMPFYNSIGEAKGDGNYNFVTSGSSEIPSFTLPTNLAAGDYRMRYKVDWAYTDADALDENRSNNYITDISGVIIDFTLRIEGTSGGGGTDPDPGTETGPFTVQAETATNGSIALFANGGYVANGTKLSAGQTITVVTTPKTGYELEAIYVNNVALPKGVNTFTLTTNTTVRATFVRQGTAQTDGFISVFVYKNNNTTLKVTIESGMTTTFDQHSMNMHSDKGDISVPYSEIDHWNFSYEPGDDSEWTGLDDVATEGQDVAMRGDRIEMSNLPAGSVVAIYSIDGRMVSQERVSGDYTLYLSTLAKGVYVVTVNNQSIKISVK